MRLRAAPLCGAKRVRLQLNTFSASFYLRINSLYLRACTFTYQRPWQCNAVIFSLAVYCSCLAGTASDAGEAHRRRGVPLVGSMHILCVRVCGELNKSEKLNITD